MAGAGIRLTGREEALAVLGGIVARTTNPRPMFESIGLSLVTSTQRRFEQGRGPSGSPWPPSLRVLAHGGKTLVLSARLMQSISFIASDQRVEVGTNVIYAAVHQLGGTIGQGARSQTLHFKVNQRTGARRFAKARRANETRTVEIGPRTIRMPARPFLGLDDNDEREIIRIAQDFVAPGAGQP